MIRFCRYGWISLWLLLALLPLRGWAQVAMHLPGGGGEPVASSAVPCHGDAMQGDSAAGPSSCQLCDLCHAFAAAPVAVTPMGDDFRAPWVTTGPDVRVVMMPSPFFRPPRI